MILFYFLTWQNLFKKKQKQYKTTVLADILEAVLHTTGAECLYHSPMWLKNIECCIYRRESRQPCTRKHKKETILKWHWGRQRTAEEGGCVITCCAETISDRVRMGKERMICKRKKTTIRKLGTVPHHNPSRKYLHFSFHNVRCWYTHAHHVEKAHLLIENIYKPVSFRVNFPMIVYFLFRASLRLARDNLIRGMRLW